MRIEDYALISDMLSAALVGRDGSIDWLCFPRFDSDAVFAALLGDEENGHWRLAPRAGGTCTRRRYRGDTMVLETEWDGPRRHRAGHRLHAAARRGARRRPDRRGRLRRGRDAQRAAAALRLRRRRAVGASPGRQLAAVAGPGRRLARVRRRAPRPRLRVLRRLHGRGRRARLVRPDLAPVAPAPARTRSTRWRRSTTPSASGSRGPTVHVRRAVPRGRPALADHAQGADVRADRRHRRGRDDLAAGGARRRAQLGLPLLLAARRDVHPSGAGPDRLHRRGGRVAGVAAARDRRQPGPAADHVRRRRRAAASRSASCRGCPGYEGSRRSGSATARSTSCSSTCTAR